MPEVTEPVVWREPVQSAWIDYNGHLSEPYYVLVFGHATDAVMDHVGLGAQHRASSGTSLFTVEAHVRYLDQVPPGADLEVRSWVVGASGKLLRIWHELRVEGTLRATEEVLGVHVDAGSGRSTPFPEAVTRLVAAAEVPPPDDAGRAIALRGTD
jgi:acyl-CoA thioester hydrolase